MEIVHRMCIYQNKAAAEDRKRRIEQFGPDAIDPNEIIWDEVKDMKEVGNPYVWMAVRSIEK